MLKGISYHQQTHRAWDVSLDDVAMTEADLSWIWSKPWNGVISRHTTPAMIKACVKLGIPLIDLDDTPATPGISKIRPDNMAIGHLAAEYFLERKFRHFAFCGVSNQAWSSERRDGFQEALSLAGHHSAVFEAGLSGDAPSAWDANAPGVLAAWLQSLPRQVAIMAGNDYCAAQTVRAAHTTGFRVPEEVAVLGVNNDVLRCELSNPPVSSVAVNAFQSGRQAAEHLDWLMAGERSDAINIRIEPAGIVTRKSTDILSMRDKDVAAALNYIRQHACEGITVDQVLTHVFISRSQLEHKFRRYIGCSPQVEIRRVQIARICQLLVETDLPLKEISERAGFDHVEYMSVVFKRVTGETPGHYRKNIQAQEQARALAIA